jgi:orotate phosphoribosyltransferase
MDSKKEVAEKLLQINAIKLSVDNPFTWASGWKSPIYCDNRKILSYPYVRDFIKSEMCNVVFQSFPQAEILAGVASAGVPWGAMVADQLKLPFIYGKSSLLVADVLLKAGLEVEGLVSIFTYGFKEAVNSFAKSNIKCISLTDYDALISLAIDKNIVSQNDQNTLLNWRTDPANWNAKS